MRIEDILNLKGVSQSPKKNNENTNDQENFFDKEKELIILNFRKYL